MISLKSKITQKILNYFFLNPDDSLYVNEIERKLGLDKRNLVKKLKELERESILISNKRGNLKIYSINEKHSLYNEYRKIILKTVGIESRLKELVEGMEGVEQVFIYGSYVKDKMDIYSDVDILVVGNHSVISLQRKISALQKEIGREINVLNLDEKEFKKRTRNKDVLIKEVKKSNIRLI